jgi:hypothetical protein
LSDEPLEGGGDAYKKHRDRAGRRSTEASAKGRDIGPIPKCVNPERRAACAKDLTLYLKTYFARHFTLPWSQDHLDDLATLQIVVTDGGLDAIAMPRGNGKTTMCEGASIFGVSYGYRKFAFLLGATGEAASELLDSIKVELETNELLFEDFPEICFPIRQLEGIAQRTKGQLSQGEQTSIEWKPDVVVLPTIAGSPSSGAIIKTKGITGGIRGARHKRRDGTIVRPDLCIIDDPQTFESAHSETQTKARLKIITNDVLGLAGTGETIAAAMPCTVIVPGDVADQVLDRQKHPVWQGVRQKLIYRFPDDTDHWDEYAEIRREDQRAYAGQHRAKIYERCNAYYAQHRAVMDAGAEPAWKERHEKDELSAIQHAMNLRIDRGDDFFFAEMQNEPRVEESKEFPLLTDAEICARFNGRGRGEVPAGCEWLTCYTDVQQEVLFWKVLAWSKGFTGYVVDWGTYPDQRVRNFTKQSLTARLADVVKGGQEAQWYGGLDAIGETVLGREWKRDDGTAMRINRALVDMSWGSSTNTVFKWCRETKYSSLVMPSQGVGIGPDNVPISSYKAKEGERIGEEWVVAPSPRGLRFLRLDTNYWKTFAEARIRAAKGDHGALTVFGKGEADLRLLGSHWTSEFRVKTYGRNRAVDVWKAKPGRPDNDFWDCLVGNHVAASMLGVSLGVGLKAQPAKRRKGSVSYIE